MAAYAPEREKSGSGHQVVIAAAIGILAVATLYLDGDAQQRVAQVFQSTLLRPFIGMQETLQQARMRADQIDVLQGEVDSLTAVLSTQSAVSAENRELRELLGLAERAAPSYRRATLIRPGTPGSESMFILDVGSDDGVEMYAPVVNARGLVGRVREVRARSSVGIDWTHPDFRAGAMLEDGSAYGMAENVRGEFREEDRLVLNGTAYHESLPNGARVLTSGFGGTYPRGIPIGVIDGTAEVEGTWRKSYWLRPSVEPAAVTHVLVATRGAPEDVAPIWPADGPAVDPELPPGEPGP
jgi:rod shape-determining protein MreC